MAKSVLRTKLEWQKWAELRLKKLIPVAQVFPELMKKGPDSKNPKSWKITIQLVNRAVMTELNSQYRGKAYPTDILSFPTFPPFRNQGILGELVICLPTLKDQARQLKHSPEWEFEVLLVHGFLHLLGFDHEKGGREAVRMAQWETKLLDRAFSEKKRPLHIQGFGLIDRSKSGS